MHLHMHLKECRHNYGPWLGFWFYAFERYNGILGYVPNNNRSIEFQLVNQFLRNNGVHSAQYPHEFNEQIATEVLKLYSLKSGSLADILLRRPQHVIDSHSPWTIPADAVLATFYSRHVIDQSLLSHLHTLYLKLYNTSLASV